MAKIKELNNQIKNERNLASKNEGQILSIIDYS